MLHLVRFQKKEWSRRLRSVNWELFDLGVSFYVEKAAELREHAAAQKLLQTMEQGEQVFADMAARRQQAFKREVFL